MLNGSHEQGGHDHLKAASINTPWLPRAGIAVVALIAVAALLTAGPAVAQQATLVRVDEVQEKPLEQTVPVVGRLVACRAGVLAARVTGAVDDVRVEVGDRVTQGEVVAVLDRRPATAELDLRAARAAEAQAALDAAEAEVQLRRQELERLEGLRASPAFSKGQFSDKRQEVAMATGAVAKARAALASAEAEVRLAQITLDDTEIRAPYDAAVTQRHTEVGAHVSPGDSIVSLVDDHCLEIEADVPQNRIRSLTPGAQVSFAIDGLTAGATVRAIVPQENPLTRTRTVRFAPELESLSGLAANQSVTVHVPAGQARAVLSVHKDAVINRGGRPSVFVVADGKAEARPVRLGEAVGSYFEVLEGLSQGDLVVVRGNERLRPGQAVAYEEAASKAAEGDPKDDKEADEGAAATSEDGNATQGRSSTPDQAASDGAGG